MTKTSTTNTTKTSTLPHSIRDEVEEFISGYKIALAYPKEIGEIRESLNTRWQSLSAEYRSKEKDSLAEILEARNLAAKQHNNVIAREREIRRYEFGNIENIEATMNEMNYRTHQNHVYRDNLSREEQIEFIKTSEDPITHVDRLSKVYRDLVLDARTQTQDLLDAESKKFFTLVKEGREATKEEIEKTRKYSVALSIVSRYALSPSALGLIGLTKYLGRGMISDSEVTDDSRYERYVKTRNALLVNLRSELGTKRPEINKIIDQFEQVCNNPILDEQQLLQLQRQLISEIGKLENIDEKELKKVHERVDKLNSEMKEEMEKILKDEDQTWPYVAFQMALLVTPLAGFSFIGMAGGIVEPLFDGNLTFGGSVGAVIANIPGFGHLFHLMKIDYAIAFILDNCPIVKNITDVLGEVTNNTFTQEAFSLLAPVATTQLAVLGLAGAYHGYVLDPKLSERDKDGNFVRSKSDAQKELVEAKNKEMKGEMERIKNDQEFEKKRQQVISQSQRKLDAESNKLAFEALKEKMIETETLKAGDLNRIFYELPVGSTIEEMLTKITQNPELLSKASERMIAYDHFNKDIEAFEKGKNLIPKIVKDHLKETLGKVGDNLRQKFDLARFFLLHNQDTLEKVFDGLELTRQKTKNLVDHVKENGDSALKELPSLLEMSENQNLIKIALEKISAATGQNHNSASPKEKRDILIKFISESSEKDLAILQELPLKLNETEVGSVSDFKQKQSFTYPSEVLHSLALSKPEVVRECIERMNEYLTPKKSVEPSTAQNVSGKNPSHNLRGQTRPGVSITA